MKYSELISFSPIESTIQLKESNRSKAESANLVKTYVMSDSMAENLKAPVIDQLQMDEVVDNKGILIIGNYGTGKSHLMSVISAVANDESNLEHVQNAKFAESMKCVAGKFEVLRVEIGGVTMPLRDILFGFIQEDFDERGVDFEVPDLDNVRDNKKLIKDMMMAFEAKYGSDKGYLIIVDEFLAYLESRSEREIVLDLEFMRALGEMCSKCNLRVMFGVQQKIFDNPKFSFVSNTLMHVRDRFTQVSIKGEDTAYVVSERILKKTPEQKAMIRAHLEKFCSLYDGMASRLDQFVEMFPIHPAYIDVFNKLYLVESRHILKNISMVIRDIFNQEVPADAPGIYSFDSYWAAIKTDGLLKTDSAIGKVVDASSQLEEIINRAFPKPAYKPLALKIIAALSVHRLQNNDLTLKFGMTAENLKDDLCLYLPMPEQDADFLLGIITATLRDIMSTVSGQFLIHDESNNQYYIDVNKVVDYDEKIRQRSSLLDNEELNRAFYQVTYSCLEWEKKQYVPGFNIYEYDLNWQSHNVFREGYLFMGIPGERSTAQPERDFYIHIMPPYVTEAAAVNNLEDEVYFYFKSTDDFKETLAFYAAAQALANISDGGDKDAYLQKANLLRKKLVKHLTTNKNTCFDVMYKKERKQLIEVLRGKYNQDATFGDTIELAAALCLDEYFTTIYPDFPVMKVKITRRNMAETVRAAYDYFAGRKNNQTAVQVLQSFGILDDDKIRPEGSKYVAPYIEMVKALPAQGVLNYSDLFESAGDQWHVDKKFKLWHIFTPIIFLSMVYSGYTVITLNNGETITASNLDKVPRLGVMDLYEFKYLSKPAQMALAELKKLFDVIGINPALLDNPNNHTKAVEDLLQAAQALSNQAVMSETKIGTGFDLWGEPLANQMIVQRMHNACSAIKNEFSNYSAKFNTPAKLNNFTLSFEQIDAIATQIATMNLIPELLEFKSACTAVVTYISTIEFMELGDTLKADIEDAKADFRAIRDDIIEGTKGADAAAKVTALLEKIKDKYIDIYFEEHKQRRLGLEESQRRVQLQECAALANLRKLRGIEILSSAKLSEIEQELAGLKTCYNLTPAELKTNPVCPHCRFSIDEKTKRVHGQISALEDRIDTLIAEWTNMLLDTISDPLVLSQKEYLSKQQIAAVDAFIAAGALPEHVDDFFVKSIQALLKNYEPVVIKVDELMRKLEELPPMDEASFKEKLGEFISDYTAGKDASTLRIVVKRHESEE